MLLTYYKQFFKNYNFLKKNQLKIINKVMKKKFQSNINTLHAAAI